MKRIVIILPYFGPFPNYIDFFFESIKNNNTVDWILFTDNVVELKITNLRIENMSFEDFKRFFVNYFDFPIDLSFPYKLCDYRIFYGLVLDDYVRTYDFWGFCDLDVIFGDIRKVVTDGSLEKYDHFFGLGHFQLQRVNDPVYIKAIEDTKAKGKYSYREVYQNENYIGLDELPFGLPHSYFKLNKDRYFNEFDSNYRPYEDVEIGYLNFYDGYNSIYELGEKYKRTMYYRYKHIVKFWGRDRDKAPQKMNYCIYQYNCGKLYKIFSSQGKIFKKELLYVHYRKRDFKISTKSFNRFLIVPNKFVNYIETPSIIQLWIYGRKRYLYVGLVAKKIRRKVNKFITPIILALAKQTFL